MIVDYLNLTTPKGPDSAIADPALGEILQSGGVLPTLQKGLYESLTGGTVRLGSRGQVDTFGVSGAACEALRASGQWQHLLWYFHERDHRVTLMDVALDVRVPAAAHIHRWWKRARSGSIKFTHKALLPRQVSVNLAPALYDGCERSTTGTLYLGLRRQQEVTLTMYDKRQERMARGFDDPGPWLRLEGTLKGVGLCLGDVDQPERVFSHYFRSVAGEYADLSAYDPWEPMGAGYTLDKPASRTPMEKLAYEVEGSALLDHWMQLADQGGPYGRAHLLKLIARRLNSGADAEVQPALGEVLKDYRSTLPQPH